MPLRFRQIYKHVQLHSNWLYSCAVCSGVIILWQQFQWCHYFGAACYQLHHFSSPRDQDPQQLCLVLMWYTCSGIWIQKQISLRGRTYFRWGYVCIVIPMLHSVILCVNYHASILWYSHASILWYSHASIPLSVAGKLLSWNIDNVNGSRMKWRWKELCSHWELRMAWRTKVCFQGLGLAVMLTTGLPSHWNYSAFSQRDPYGYFWLDVAYADHECVKETLIDWLST